jgi:DNA repair exonuclease SbcCD ATPase subunit
MTVVEPKAPGQEPPKEEGGEEPTGIQVPVTEPETKPEPKAEEPKAESKPSGKTFSAEDIEKARKEEKDKLYKSLEDMKGELAALRKEREDREKAAKEAEKQAAAEAKRKADEEKSAKELLAEKEQEWEQKFHSLQQERERDQAILAQERQFNALMEYRSQRMQEETENILPELIDMIGGNNQEEIEASIERLRERTAKIVGNVQQAQQQARQQMPGTKVTAPPVGPVENQPGYETLSADDIRNMDMATYAKRREQLLGAAAKNRNKGLFG